VDLEQFKSGKFGEDGDFVLEPYRFDIHHRDYRLVLRRDGSIRRPESAYPISLTKEFTFAPGEDRIEVAYILSSSYPGGVDVVFAVENNFSFQAGHAEDRFILTDRQPDKRLYLDEVARTDGGQAIAMIDQYRSLGVGLRTDQPADIWHLPILTVSLSEGGFEKVYQGTTIVHRYELHLTEQPLRLRFYLDAGDMNTVLAHLAATSAVSK
jgi:alpha-amylase